MSIHPVLVRGMLTAIVAQVTPGQRLALCSADDAARIAAEDRLVDDVMTVMAAVDRSSDEVGASLEFQQHE